MAHYDVFICHSSTAGDYSIAEKLKHELVRYRIPGKVNRMHKRSKIDSVFLDPERAADWLPDSETLDALRNSRFLIVICSPSLLKSTRAMAIIDTFWNLKKGRDILTLLAEGKPSESFPSQVRKVVKTIWLAAEERYEDIEIEVEPLAADLSNTGTRNFQKDFKIERLRLIAPILGCTFDDLRRRHLHNVTQKISLIFIIVAIVAGLMILSGYSFIRDVAEKEKALLAKEKQVAVEAERAKKLNELAIYSIYRFYTDLDQKTQNRPEIHQKIIEFLKTRTGVDYQKTPNGEVIRKNNVFGTVSELASLEAFLRVNDYDRGQIKILEILNQIFGNEFKWMPEYILKAIDMHEADMNYYCLFVCQTKPKYPLKCGDLIYAIEGRQFTNRNELWGYIEDYRKYKKIGTYTQLNVTFFRLDGDEVKKYRTSVNLDNFNWILL